MRALLVAGHCEGARRMKRIAKLQTRARGPKDLERCVFVVDDDQSVRTSLATLLSTEDYVVETFAIAAG